MPPKKAKLPKEKLKSLVDEFNIRFEGPVPSKSWPGRYSHLFQVILEIGTNRYDDYKKRTGVYQTAARERKKQVRELRVNVAKFRMDFNINEETWRESVEPHVFRRFDKEIVCTYCRNESWESEHNAQPFDKDEKEKLERKRDRRRLCVCNDGNTADRNPNEDSDEENQTKIFSTAIGEVVSHDPQDRLEHSRIPMKPDRVIGLSMNEQYRGYIGASSVELSHSPVKGRQLLYPFLIHEAKREQDAPGFRYVEVQTAFPIRRFLRIQDELQTASNIELDPIVWFFANQGEDWRLYGAVLDDKKRVRIYHLWHGNIESQDGALQILQIVDFVWTWARDVYRPRIRMCLRGYDGFQREISPTSTTAATRSQSVLTVLNAPSFSEENTDVIEEDDITLQDGMNDEEPKMHDASSHPFLKWADSRNASIPWTAQANIRHSNIVIFSFRILEIPENHQSFYDLVFTSKGDHENPEVMLHALKVIQQNQYTISINRDQIHDFERYWTGTSAETSHTRNMTNHTDETVRAFFLFRTFCQEEDWQLKRELYCVIWSSRAASLLSTLLGEDMYPEFEGEPEPPTQTSDFLRACQPLQRLSGRQSVAYALDNISLILLPCTESSGREKQLQWREPQNQGIPDHVIVKSVAWFDIASSGHQLLQSFHHQQGKLLWVVPNNQEIGVPPELTSVPDTVGKGGAMLVLKPRTWPHRCPRFCLFVLLERTIQGEARLGQLLRYVVEHSDVYGAFEDRHQVPEGLSATDTQLLQKWEEYFD